MRLRRIPPAAAPLSARDLWRGARGFFGGDEATARVERELADVLRVKRVFLTSSGRAGLTLTLKALVRLSPVRREVILPAYTCFSVPAAVDRAGLTVGLCDVDPDTLDFNYAELEQLVAARRPLCVVSTHLFGRKADTRRVVRLCRPYGVAVIDDAAQALGLHGDDGPLGTLGDAGLYSFGRGKAVTCVRGGAIVTNSDDLGRALALAHRALPSPGLGARVRTLIEAIGLLVFLRPSLYPLPASLPFLGLGETEYSTRFPITRLSGVEAGLLGRWPIRLADANERRAARAESLARQVGGASRRDRLPYLRLPLLCETREERDRLLRESDRRGLGFSVMYPSALHEVPELGRFNLTGRYPGAERLAACLLTVPVHPFVSNEDGDCIGALLSDARIARAVAG